MLSNYLVSFIRNFTKRKLFSFINALGLSIAIAFSILTYLFIQDELSFDRFHSNGEKIYRINRGQLDENALSAGNEDPYSYQAMQPNRLAEVLKTEFADIQRITIFKEAGKQIVSYNEKALTQEITFVDSSFFQMFTFEPISGSTNKLFSLPTEAAISKETATRLFGNEDPIGKVITLNYEALSAESYTIRTVFNVPTNSSIRFELLLPIESYKPFHRKSWGANSYPIFIQLQKNTDPTQFIATIDTLITRNNQIFINAVRENRGLPSNIPILKCSLTKLTDVHFDKKVDWPNVSDRQYSLILAGIAFIIISIASINYISFALTTAISRRKEVGVRKVFGATRNHLFHQFNIESIGLAMVASLLGIMLAAVSMPIFNEFTNKEVSILSVLNLNGTLYLLTVVLLVGLLAGSYPSLRVARMRPVQALKGSTPFKGISFAKPLVVLQFTMSAFLMIASLIMYQQMRFVTTKNLGYNASTIISIPTHLGWNTKSDEAITRFRNKVASNPLIENVSGAVQPLEGGLSKTFDFNGEMKNVYFNGIDESYLSLFNIQLIKGRNFQSGSSSDSSAVIVNETFVKSMGWNNPLDQAINVENPGSTGGLNIIGVVKDFHFRSLEVEIEPLVLAIDPNVGGHLVTLLIKLNSMNLPAALSTAENAWKNLYPDKPFDYTFIDDAVAKQYTVYVRWMRITRLATGIALVIASLGLFGLSGVNALSRTKEIGIRKILGANFSSIFLLLNRPFVGLAFVAYLMATPVSWYLMQRWISNFTYHIQMGWEIFAFSIFIGLLIALLTVSYHGILTANANPADTLRNE
jgi:putative ABC transport system permease protein